MVTGTVTAGGAPQPGIVVGLHTLGFGMVDLPYLTTTTGDQGNYALTGLAAGLYRVSVRDPLGRFATEFYQAQPTDPNFFVSGIHATPDINFELTPAGSIRGQILTPDDELPAGFRLTVYEFVAFDDPSTPGFYRQLYHIDFLSGENGFYEIEGLKAGDYRIGAIAPELSTFSSQRFYPGTDSVESAITVTVRAGEVTEDIDIPFGHPYDTILPYIAARE
jgi:hypothetical protein